MSKEQIGEMKMTPLDVLANDIYQHCPDLKDNYCGDTHCVSCLANALYNAGYRKQEWISVYERLPTYKDGKVLIYTAYGISIAEITVNNRWRGDCAIPKLITHWMPLPEAPKMKGGAG